MKPLPTENERLRQYLENWKVVSAEIERLKAIELRGLTEEESARQFDEMDCDPSIVWRSPERIHSSGLIEQQRLFSRMHQHEPRLPRRT